MLETVGLKPTEERVYWTLLRLPAASPGELAHQLALPPEESNACLRRLEHKGLVSRTPDDPHRFRAAPPDLAFGPLLQRRQQELRTIEAAVDQMTDQYRSQVAAHRPAPLVETIHGAGALRQRLGQLGREATRQIRAMVADPSEAQYAWPVAGVPARVICPGVALELPGDPYHLARLRGTGPGGTEAGDPVDADLRLVAAPPVTMVIVDRSTALVPVRGRDGEPPVAALVHGGALLAALDALFESTWRSAVPVLLRDGPPADQAGVTAPAAEDLRLLSLLLAGLTDDAIASKMGLSRRTVQRRVRGLIELAGVRTRLQLAWQSARRGWL